jgi:hypothetical protein
LIGALLIPSSLVEEIRRMGERRVMQEALFYGFSLGMSRPITFFARSTASLIFRD